MSSSRSGRSMLKRTVMWRGGIEGGKEGEVGRDRAEDAATGTGRSRFLSVGDDEADRLLPPLRFALISLVARDQSRAKSSECDLSESETMEFSGCADGTRRARAK